VEMVVAIAIFAVISVAIYQTVARFMAMNVDLSERTDELARTNTLFLLMERDMHNYVDRTIRGPYGNTLPAWVGSADTEEQELMFEFTVAQPSWREPGRTRLTRVGWLFRNGVIIRQTWDVLDRAQDSEPVEEQAMTDVDGVALQYYVQKNERYVLESRWGSGVAPPGVMVTVSLTDGTSYVRVFDLPGG